MSFEIPKVETRFVTIGAELMIQVEVRILPVPSDDSNQDLFNWFTPIYETELYQLIQPLFRARFLETDFKKSKKLTSATPLEHINGERLRISYSFKPQFCKNKICQSVERNKQILKSTTVEEKFVVNIFPLSSYLNNSLKPFVMQTPVKLGRLRRGKKTTVLNSHQPTTSSYFQPTSVATVAAVNKFNGKSKKGKNKKEKKVNIHRASKDRVITINSALLSSNSSKKNSTSKESLPDAVDNSVVREASIKSEGICDNLNALSCEVETKTLTHSSTNDCRTGSLNKSDGGVESSNENCGNKLSMYKYKNKTNKYCKDQKQLTNLNKTDESVSSNPKQKSSAKLRSTNSPKKTVPTSNKLTDVPQSEKIKTFSKSRSKTRLTEDNYSQLAEPINNNTCKQKNNDLSLCGDFVFPTENNSHKRSKSNKLLSDGFFSSDSDDQPCENKTGKKSSLKSRKKMKQSKSSKTTKGGQDSSSSSVSTTNSSYFQSDCLHTVTSIELNSETSQSLINKLPSNDMNNKTLANCDKRIKRSKTSEIQSDTDQEASTSSDSISKRLRSSKPKVDLFHEILVELQERKREQASATTYAIIENPPSPIKVDEIQRQLKTEFKHIVPDPVKKIQALSNNEISEYYTQIKSYLRDIFLRKMETWRCVAYFVGGKTQAKLTYQAPLGIFTEAQYDFLYRLLLDTFCRSGIKYHEFVMKVLCPDAMIKIYSLAHNIENVEDAEIEMSRMVKMLYYRHPLEQETINISDEETDDV